MTRQSIGIGSAPDAGNGDPLRTAFDKSNQNFNELYLRVGGARTQREIDLGLTPSNTTYPPGHVFRYGADPTYTTECSAAIRNTMLAATPGTVCYAPAGVYKVNGLSLDGVQGTGLHGDGACWAGGQQNGTVFKSSAQGGKPVIDFEGWSVANNFRGRAVFSQFAVEGDGASNTAHSGIYLGSAAGGTHCIALRDIFIWKTGGPGIDSNQMYFGELNNVIVATPVNVVAGNVPYYRFRNANGTRVLGCGAMRDTTAYAAGVPNVANAGVFRIEDDLANAYASSHMAFRDCWTEEMALSAGQTHVHSTGLLNLHDGWAFFDSLIATGQAGTGTSHIRLAADVAYSAGGNIVRGLINGRSNNAGEQIQWGVDILQSWNRIDGIKGYRGYNVRIGAGVEYSSIALGGSDSNATDVAVVDNSGNTTNKYEDAFLDVASSMPKTAGPLRFLDGGSAPGTQAGYAQLYTDGAGNLMVKFGNGTVKTITAA